MKSSLGSALVLAVLAAGGAHAQDDSRAGSPPELLAARAVTAFGAREPPKIGANVDVRTRFAEFQRDFATDFGVDVADDPGSEGEPGGDSDSQFGEAFAKRWEGSLAYHWYEKMLGVYDRFEGFYQRVERSTRWARSGFDVDPDLEAAVDGKLRLHVEREVGFLDMGVNVDDALGGQLGLRLGGVIRGYKFGFGVSDVANNGRVSVQVRKTR